MPRYFKNRKPEEWRAVLTAFGFKQHPGDGDDQVWKHEQCPHVRILIPDRDNKTIIITTAYYMLQVIERCGVVKRSQIRQWWKANGYGD
jgi:hypothetical protein